MGFSFLIVEDEKLTARFSEEVLEAAGHQVVGIAKNAEEAHHLLETAHVDFILLDINIHGNVDGLQFAQSIATQNIAIIFISAHCDKATLDEAMTLYPYGYLVKPFNQNDLLAVLSVAISRYQIQTPTPPKQDTLIACDMQKQCLFFQEREIPLGQKELLCLELLIQHADTLVEYETLRKHVWRDKYVSDVTVRELINRIRNKVADLPLHNVYAKGYRLTMKR